MTITRERFEQGMTYDEYKAQMTRNQERFEENERAVQLAPDDVTFFKNMGQPASVLVIAEDWCGDVINNLPVLGRLATSSEKLNVRVFLRDQNLDIMDQYLKNGEFRSIPVFVVFDEQFNEIGHFIERPASVSQRNEQFRADLFANDPIMSNVDPTMSVSEMPDEIRQHYMNRNAEFRASTRAFANGEVIREVRSLFERIARPAATTESTNIPMAPQRAAGEITKTTTVEVRITYCAECGYEPQTLELTGALMRAFTQGLGSITLLPWHDGAFDVVVNGTLVHSMYRDGGFPQSDSIIEAVRERLA